MSSLEELRCTRPNPVSEELWRTPFERDADRVLYSSAFSRLRDVTQVLRPGMSHAVHDRLLHSIKVAQVGRRLAQFLRFRIDDEGITLPHTIEPDAVYSAGLAHDLGHPPFGHIGENEIQVILGSDSEVDIGEVIGLADSFEGNAQSFRIVTRLSFRSISSGQEAGLNLSWATLAALLKYPWMKGDQPTGWSSSKWGSYTSEEEYLAGVHGVIPANWIRSVEASIMDWADDITYAVHDVEDFIKAGLIPIHELYSSDMEKDDFAAYCSSSPREGLNAYSKAEILEALEHIMDSGPVRSYRGGHFDRQVMHAWASRLIDFFSERCAVDLESGLLKRPSDVKLENAIMKQLVWFYVVDHPSLSSEHQGQRRVLQELISAVYVWARQLLTDGQRLEVPQRSELRKYPSRLVDFVAISMRYDANRADGSSSWQRGALMRGVIDYVASLSDNEAIELHGRLVSAS